MIAAWVRIGSQNGRAATAACVSIFPLLLHEAGGHIAVLINVCIILPLVAMLHHINNSDIYQSTHCWLIRQHGTRGSRSYAFQFHNTLLKIVEKRRKYLKWKMASSTITMSAVVISVQVLVCVYLPIITHVAQKGVNSKANQVPQANSRNEPLYRR